MRYKKTLNEELYRINQIMVQSSNANILNEQSDKLIRKITGDQIDNFLSPDNVNRLFKRLGLEGFEDINIKYLDNFDNLIAKSSKEDWDDIILNSPVVRMENDVVRLSDNKILSVDELQDLIMKDATDGKPSGIEELADESLYNTTTRYIRELPGGGEETITKQQYDKLLIDFKDFNSLPPFLRYSYKELENALNDVTDARLTSVDDFLKALRRFYQDGVLTTDLRKAIISLMSNTPGFTKQLTKQFMKNSEFAKQVKLFRYLDRMDEMYKAISEVLGLKQGSKLIDDITVRLSREGALLEEYFDFILQSNRALKGIKDFRFGMTDNYFRTIVSDILAGGFFDYVMGAIIPKQIFRYIKTIKASPNKLKTLAANAVFAYILFGGYKSIRDWNITSGFDPRTWFSNLIDSFTNNCAGDSKVTDALTGRLYANVIGQKEVEGKKVNCGPVEFNRSFLNTYTFQNGEEKVIAENLYNALNVTSHDGHPLMIFNKIPSLIPKAKDYLGAFNPDRDLFKEHFFGDGMDIIKMSQVADYYEREFDASLLEDAKNLNFWSELTGGMNFDDLKNMIEKTPYLDGGQSDLNFDTWQEVVNENKKFVLIYPYSIVYEVEEDGDVFEEEIPLAKCGNGCKDDNDKDCKCATGGCKIGGTLVATDMAIALDKKGIKTQSELNTFVKQEDGFEKLKEIFDEVNQVSGSGCVLRPGN